MRFLLWDQLMILYMIIIKNFTKKVSYFVKGTVQKRKLIYLGKIMWYDIFIKDNYKLSIITKRT